MDSIVSTIISPIINFIVTPLVQQFAYLFNTAANVRDLKKIFVELNMTKDELQEKIATAVAVSDEIELTGQMSEWMKEVQAMEDVPHMIDKEYNDLKTCLGGCRINCWMTYRISKRAPKAHLVAKELISKTRSFDDVTKKSVPVVQRFPTLSNATMASTELYLSRVFDYSRDHEVGMLGICGMGGVGKTTLLQRINNHSSVEAFGFDYVIWVVASQDLNLDRLQKDIAKRVGLPLNATFTVESQAPALYYYLKTKNFLLLPDDIWDPLDLGKLGIPYPIASNDVEPKCKGVFTTQSETLCSEIASYQKSPVRCKMVKIEFLPIEEAQLFLDSIDEGMRSIISNDERVCDRAEQLVKKCGGLPLALVVTAPAMSGNKTWQEWADSINSLNSIGFQEMWTKTADFLPYLKNQL